jgi:hypothetical protein
MVTNMHPRYDGWMDGCHHFDANLKCSEKQRNKFSTAMALIKRALLQIITLSETMIVHKAVRYVNSALNSDTTAIMGFGGD